MAVTLSAGSSTASPVFDPHVNGGAVGARTLALTDGNEIATNGICRAVDLSSIVPASLSANGNTPDIDVAPFSNLFWYFSVGGAGNVVCSDAVHQTQFSGAGATFSNVGPVTDGGGFILTPAIQIRWTLTGGGTWSTVVSKLFGR